MTKKISLELSDESYEKFITLTKTINQEPEQTLVTLANQASNYESLIRCFYQNTPMTFEEILSDVFQNTEQGIAFFRYFLRKLKAEGLYSISDFCFDFEKDYWWFLFDNVGDDSILDGFDVTKQDGQVSLTVNSTISLNGVSMWSLNRLKEIIEEKDYETPSKGFDAIDEVDIELEENDETCRLNITCWMESFEELPSLDNVSKIVRQILRKARINLKLL